MSVVVRGGRVHDTRRDVAVSSLLFVPGMDEPALRLAMTAGAGAVVADLEDLVPDGSKSEARAVLGRVFRGAAAPLRMVRVNGPGSGLLHGDLAALEDLRVDAIVVPKAEPAALAAVSGLHLPLLPVVESAAGVRGAYDLASHPGVVGLVIGLRDLAADLGLPRPVGAPALAYTRGKLVVDCAAADVAAPFDVPATGDDAESEAWLARELGLGGKVCRTADQVRTVNRVFAGA